MQGDDELVRLGHSINATVERIAAYARELKRRRDEASHALQAADDEGLARDAAEGAKPSYRFLDVTRCRPAITYSGPAPDGFVADEN